MTSWEPGPERSSGIFDAFMNKVAYNGSRTSTVNGRFRKKTFNEAISAIDHATQAGNCMSQAGVFRELAKRQAT